MKRKQIAAPRRMFLVAAKFKSGAGAHRKSNKALRRLEKSRGYNLMVKQLAFNQLIRVQFSVPLPYKNTLTCDCVIRKSEWPVIATGYQCVSIW